MWSFDFSICVEAFVLTSKDPRVRPFLKTTRIPFFLITFLNLSKKPGTYGTHIVSVGLASSSWFCFCPGLYVWKTLSTTCGGKSFEMKVFLRNCNSSCLSCSRSHSSCARIYVLKISNSGQAWNVATRSRRSFDTR